MSPRKSWKFYLKIYQLHMSGFGILSGRLCLKTQTLHLSNKFDGRNPPDSLKAWANSTKERKKVWQSWYFEKMHTIKTTHDDFGMAVTYVPLIIIWKKMVLWSCWPATFLKLVGGEGFRKFEIRNNWCSVVDDKWLYKC